MAKLRKNTRRRQREERGPTESVCRGKRTATVLSLAMILVVLSPIDQFFRQSPRDGFPLSHYPMFSRRRNGEVTVTHLIGLDAQGRQHAIRYSHVGKGGMNQIRKRIRKQVRRGRAAEVCEKVAQRMTAKTTGIESTLTHIAAVTSTYRLDDFMQGHKFPTELRTEARVSIPRPASMVLDEDMEVTRSAGP